MVRTRSFHRHIYFVDDDPVLCKIVGRVLEQLSSEISCFTHPHDCLEQLRLQVCDLLITDVKMPGTGMDGIELLTEARRIAPFLPVLVITGYGDVPMAVRAMKAGALDFVRKPLNRATFLSVVKSILKRVAPIDTALGKKLTKTEMRVLRLLMKGKTNKEVARLLHRVLRTIESHRRQIYRKLGVKNSVELTLRAAELGLVNLPRKRSRPKPKSRKDGASK